MKLILEGVVQNKEDIATNVKHVKLKPTKNDSSNIQNIQLLHKIITAQNKRKEWCRLNQIDVQKRDKKKTVIPSFTLVVVHDGCQNNPDFPKDIKAGTVFVLCLTDIGEDFTYPCAEEGTMHSNKRSIDSTEDPVATKKKKRKTSTLHSNKRSIDSTKDPVARKKERKT